MRAAIPIAASPLRTGVWGLVGAMSALLAINLQLWGFDTPPLVDWPNHLARHILQCGAAGAEQIARYYTYDLEIVPNLSSELIHTLPLACRNVEITQKFLIQYSSLGLVISTVLLHRVIWGEYSVWPILSALIMHHMAWAYGFENFVIAVPVTLLVLAFWFALSNRSVVLRLLLMWPCVVGVYILHLYAFGFLFLAVSLLELERVWRQRRSETALHLAGMTLALLAALASFPALHTLTALQASPEIETNLFAFGGIEGLGMTLVSPFVGHGNPLESQGSLIAALLTMVAGMFVLVMLRVSGQRVEMDRRIRGVLPLLLIVTLAAPYNFSGVYFSNIRFPCLLLALAIAGTRVQFSTRGIWVFTVVVLLVVSAKTTWIASKWRLHDAQVTELREAAAFLSPSDRILLARDRMSLSVILHAHSASYILRDQGPYWRGMFTGGNSLSPRPEYAARDHTQPFPFDWRLITPDYAHLPEFEDGGKLHDWTAFYTHLIVFFDHDDPRMDPVALGRRVHAGSFFDIYDVAPPE